MARSANLSMPSDSLAAQAWPGGAMASRSIEFPFPTCCSRLPSPRNP